MKAKVFILPKKDVLDPQGKAIKHSLRTLGFNNVSDIRMGKYLELELNDNLSKEELETEVEEMCKKLLANLNIEDYKFSIDK